MMKPFKFLFVTVGLIALATAAVFSPTVGMVFALSAAPMRNRKPLDAFQIQVRPLLDRYCIDCHVEENAEAGIDLDRFEDQESAVNDGKTWIRVRDAVQGHVMPPANKPQPSLEESNAIISWIENDFLAAQCGKQVGSPSVAIRRLNRQEYDNTIRDLLGLDLHLSAGFPPDEIGFGYDNVGSALNISPIHVEKYLDAAELALGGSPK